MWECDDVSFWINESIHQLSRATNFLLSEQLFFLCRLILQNIARFNVCRSSIFVVDCPKKQHQPTNPFCKSNSISNNSQNKHKSMQDWLLLLFTFHFTYENVFQAIFGYCEYSGNAEKWNIRKMPSQPRCYRRTQKYFFFFFFLETRKQFIIFLFCFWLVPVAIVVCVCYCIQSHGNIKHWQN